MVFSVKVVRMDDFDKRLTGCLHDSDILRLN